LLGLSNLKSEGLLDAVSQTGFQHFHQSREPSDYYQMKNSCWQVGEGGNTNDESSSSLLDLDQNDWNLTSTILSPQTRSWTLADNSKNQSPYQN